MIVGAEQAGFGEEITFAGAIQDNLGPLRRETCQAHFAFNYTINRVYFITEPENILPLTYIYRARSQPKRIWGLIYPIFFQGSISLHIERSYKLPYLPELVIFIRTAFGAARHDRLDSYFRRNNEI